MATWKRLRARKAAKDSPKTMAILELCRTVKGKTPHVLSSIWAGFSMQLFITCLNGRAIVTAFTSSKEKISSHGLPPETSSKTAGLLMPLSYSHVSRCPHPEPHCLQNKKPPPEKKKKERSQTPNSKCPVWVHTYQVQRQAELVSGAGTRDNSYPWVVGTQLEMDRGPSVVLLMF